MRSSIFFGKKPRTAQLVAGAARMQNAQRIAALSATV
jgi:hypothetical protein